MYVALTRARQQLVLSHAQSARRFGQTYRVQPSRFLGELPAADLLRDGDDPNQHVEARDTRTRERLGAIAALLGE